MSAGSPRTSSTTLSPLLDHSGTSGRLYEVSTGAASSSRNQNVNDVSSLVAARSIVREHALHAETGPRRHGRQTAVDRTSAAPTVARADWTRSPLMRSVQQRGGLHTCRWVAVTARTVERMVLPSSATASRGIVEASAVACSGMNSVHQCRATRPQVRCNALEGALCRVVVGQQVERGPGQIDRRIATAEVHRLERGVMEDHVETPRGRPRSAALEHVRRRVEALDVQTTRSQIENGIAIAAAELERRLTRQRHEPGVWLGVEVSERRCRYSCATKPV